MSTSAATMNRMVGCKVFIERDGHGRPISDTAIAREIREAANRSMQLRAARTVEPEHSDLRTEEGRQTRRERRLANGWRTVEVSQG